MLRPNSHHISCSWDKWAECWMSWGEYLPFPCHFSYVSTPIPPNSPLLLFPLCTQLLSSFPQQEWEGNKWSCSRKKPQPCTRVSGEWWHLSVYLSISAQPGWAKDLCGAGGSWDPAGLWIYGFPVPSAGTELACAGNPTAPATEQMLLQLSADGVTPIHLPGWFFLGSAKGILPAAEHLQSHSAQGPSRSPPGFPHLPSSCWNSVKQPQIRGEQQMEVFFFFGKLTGLNFYIHVVLRERVCLRCRGIAVIVLRWGCKDTAGKLAEQWKL